MVNHVLRNTLKFTSAPMIVSIERETYQGQGGLWCGSYGKTELYLAQYHRDRVRINPRATSAYGSASLAGHLSNLAFCEQSGLPCAEPDGGAISFVMLDGDQLFIRPGLEQWVMQHSVAFCPSGDCSTLPMWPSLQDCVKPPRASRPPAGRACLGG